MQCFLIRNSCCIIDCNKCKFILSWLTCNYLQHGLYIWSSTFRLYLHHYRKQKIQFLTARSFLAVWIYLLARFLNVLLTKNVKCNSCLEDGCFRRVAMTLENRWNIVIIIFLCSKGSFPMKISILTHFVQRLHPVWFPG